MKYHETSKGDSHLSSILSHFKASSLKRSGHAGRDGMIWWSESLTLVVSVMWPRLQLGYCLAWLLEKQEKHQLFLSADLICPIAQRYTFIYLFKHCTPFLHSPALSLHQPQHPIGLRVSHHNQRLHSMRGLHLLLLPLLLNADGLRPPNLPEESKTVKARLNYHISSAVINN